MNSDSTTSNWDKTSEELNRQELEIKSRNAEKREQREKAETILKSKNINLQDIASIDSRLGRKLEREIRRAENTGRVSNWLAGEVIKAEAAQNAAQQSAFRRQVMDVISSPLATIPLTPPLATYTPPLYRKPEIQEAGGRGNVPPHPWQILLRSNEGVVEYKVELNSALYSGIGSFTNIPITGLDFWAAAEVGYLYLFGVVENGVCTDASIQGPEAIPSDRIDFVDDEQNTFSFIIGYIYDDGDGNLVVKQDAFHNLTLINMCVNGKSVIYPMAT